MTAPTTAPSLELFRCEPMSARLTRSSCAAQYRRANGPSEKRVSGPHPARLFGRAACIDCRVGAAHAAGKVVPVERLTWSSPASSPATPTSRPTTTIPVVEGVLDAKRTKEQKMTGPISMETRARDVGDRARGMKVREAADKYGVAQQSIRNWVKAAQELREELTPAPAPRVMDQTELADDDDLALLGAVVTPSAPEPAAEACPAMPPPPLEPASATPSPASTARELDIDADPAAEQRAPNLSLAALELLGLVPATTVDTDVARLPRDVRTLIARLGVNARITRAIDCIYMAGTAQTPKRREAWLDEAAAYVVEDQRERATRGAA